MILNVIAFSSRQFTYTEADRTFVSEASDLDNRHLQRIYDDACDVGLAIQSDKTGRVVRFYMDGAKTDGEGELTHWTYKPLPEDVRRMPDVADLKVIVFND